MTRKIAKFEAWHVQLLLSDGVAENMPNFQPDILQFMERSNSFTLVVNNMPVLCGGTFEQWPGRHVAWAYLNKTTGKHMLWTTRKARDILGAVKGRLEMTVRSDFAAGQRWAKMLGFEVETPRLRQYGPEGEDHIGYVRFN